MTHQPQIFIFSSDEPSHLEIAEDHQMWAIRSAKNFKAAKTKSVDMQVGDFALFYSAELNHSFLMPSIVTEVADVHKVYQGNPWPGPDQWHCPFRFRSLLSLDKRMPLSKAKALLPDAYIFLKRGGHVLSYFTISPNCVFAPSLLTATDLVAMLSYMSTRTNAETSSFDEVSTAFRKLQLV